MVNSKFHMWLGNFSQWYDVKQCFSTAGTWRQTIAEGWKIVTKYKYRYFTKILLNYWFNYFNKKILDYNYNYFTKKVIDYRYKYLNRKVIDYNYNYNYFKKYILTSRNINEFKKQAEFICAFCKKSSKFKYISIAYHTFNQILALFLPLSQCLGHFYFLLVIFISWESSGSWIKHTELCHRVKSQVRKNFKYRRPS